MLRRDLDLRLTEGATTVGSPGWLHGLFSVSLASMLEPSVAGAEQMVVNANPGSQAEASIQEIWSNVSWSEIWDMADEAAQQRVRTGSINAKDAEDFAAETILHLLKQGAKLDTSRPWIRKILRRRWIDAIRRSATAANHRELVGRHRAQYRETDDSGESSRIEHLNSALAKVDDKDRALFLAKYLDGKSVSELAAEEGVSDRWIQVRLKNTRDRLRDLIASEECADFQAQHHAFDKP